MGMMSITFSVDFIHLVARGCETYGSGEEGAFYNGVQ